MQRDASDLSSIMIDWKEKCGGYRDRKYKLVSIEQNRTLKYLKPKTLRHKLTYC